MYEKPFHEIVPKIPFMLKWVGNSVVHLSDCETICQIHKKKDHAYLYIAIILYQRHDVCLYQKHT